MIGRHYIVKRLHCTNIEAEVIDDKHVIYDGKQWSLSGIATYLLNARLSVQGPKYFKYNDEWLTDIRRRLNV